MKYGQTIKELRLKKGMKQYQLADKLGIIPNHLSQIENGHKEPGKEMLQRIGEALDVPVPVIVWIAMSAEDVPERDREMFTELKCAVDALIEAHGF